jgi:hypothetical protein
MDTIFFPVDDAPIPASGRYTLAISCAIDSAAVPVAPARFERALREHAISGGRIQSYKEYGSLVARPFGIYELDLPRNAKRLVDTNTTRFVAVKVDSDRIVDCWLADRPTAEITKLERIAKSTELAAVGKLTFNKSATVSPKEDRNTMEPQNLEEALRKCLSNPGLLRKDSSIAPGAYARPNIEELDPPAKTPSRTLTAPAGTINVSELARANDEIRVIGGHLQAAMRENPSSRPIGDAGMAWYAISSLGLGIDALYAGGAQTVATTPNSEALNEAIARSDKTAGGFLDFREALTKVRRAPIVDTRNGGEISSRPVFSKSDSKSFDGGSEAGQYLRRAALDSARARLQVLGQKLDAALTANPDSAAVPHLRAAQAAHREATKHINSCLKDEDYD